MLKAVAMDMSKSYISAVTECLPSIDIVFDRFHIMQIVNKTLDKIRRKQQVEMTKAGYEVVKGNRFLLLSNYDELEEDKKKRVDSTLEANEPLLIMHTMKENLRFLWSKENDKKGRKFLVTWAIDAIEMAMDYESFTHSKVLRPLKKLAFTLLKHMNGILNYFKHRISNGRIEGTNNKIKTLKRQVYGFRDIEYFKLRLLHLHVQKRRLAG